VGDALASAHLLDLKEDGVAILKHEREMPTHRDAAHPLQLDDPGPHRRAHLLVLEEVEHVVPRDLLMSHAPSSSSPYASARMRMGCRAPTPVPCLIWRAARGQSVATRVASAARTSSKSGSASLMDSPQDSFFLPHVAATAPHRPEGST